VAVGGLPEGVFVGVPALQRIVSKDSQQKSGGEPSQGSCGPHQKQKRGSCECWLEDGGNAECCDRGGAWPELERHLWGSASNTVPTSRAGVNVLNATYNRPHRCRLLKLPDVNTLFPCGSSSGLTSQSRSSSSSQSPNPSCLWNVAEASRVFALPGLELQLVLLGPHGCFSAGELVEFPKTSRATAGRLQRTRVDRAGSSEISLVSTTNLGGSQLHVQSFHQLPKIRYSSNCTIGEISTAADTQSAQ
jgi:hypothetical protein